MSKIICDFCGATDSKNNPVIAGDNACICKSCVTAANEIMTGNLSVVEDQSKTALVEPKEIKIKTPAELKKILDEYVIGQERAKKF